MAEPPAGSVVKVYHLRPEGSFWRLSLEPSQGPGVRFFDSWERALGAAIDVAEGEAPSRLLVFRDGERLEADLAFKKTGN